MAKRNCDISMIQRAQAGDQLAVQALLEQFSATIYAISTSDYYLCGGDEDDLFQIGQIGFAEAIRKYDPSKNIDFARFAKVCVHRKVIDAIREANRKKHRPLNTAVEYDAVSVAGSVDPEQRFLMREQLQSVYAAIDVKLSDYEKLVLTLYVDGLSYQEIAARTGKSRKSVDNAISRIRSKLVSCP